MLAQPPLSASAVVGSRLECIQHFDHQSLVCVAWFRELLDLAKPVQFRSAGRPGSCPLVAPPCSLVRCLSRHDSRHLTSTSAPFSTHISNSCGHAQRLQYCPRFRQAHWLLGPRICADCALLWLFTGRSIAHVNGPATNHGITARCGIRATPSQLRLACNKRFQFRAASSCELFRCVAAYRAVKRHRFGGCLMRSLSQFYVVLCRASRWSRLFGFDPRLGEWRPDGHAVAETQA